MKHVYGIDAYRYAYKRPMSYRIAGAMFKLAVVGLLAIWLTATFIIAMHGGI